LINAASRPLQSQLVLASAFVRLPAITTIKQCLSGSTGTTQQVIDGGRSHLRWIAGRLCSCTNRTQPLPARMLRFAKSAIIGIPGGAVDVSWHSLSPRTLQFGFIPYVPGKQVGFCRILRFYQAR
jgi:hypothetical protein